MAKFRKIGILTSGGDAPGMNACIKAVVSKALTLGVEVVGINRGYQGLIEGDLRPLLSKHVANIMGRGGTILYSSRSPMFKTEEGMAAAICVKRNAAPAELDGAEVRSELAAAGAWL